ncbi:hypothetical protein LDENG_00017900 [Lucifuga dentata]|nr:hypothetical protein LDENG_00017900 [Lucifuga dentata]
MVKYEVIVTTSNLAQATTMNNVFIKLVGTDGESNRTWLTSILGTATFILGAQSKFNVSCPATLGKLVLIELDKKALPLLPEDSWFPSKVQVKSPEGNTYNFPIYRWINDFEVHLFREGTALRIFEDSHHLGKYCREKELKLRERQYCWDVYEEGLPHCIQVDNPLSLPCEVRFSFTKTTQFLLTASTG